METIFLTKIPIFDEEKKVFGFEIKYVFEEGAMENDFNLLVKKIFITLSDIDITNKTEGKVLFIGLSADIIIFTDFTSLFPSNHFIIKVPASKIRSKVLLDKLRELKLKNYKFCLYEIKAEDLDIELLKTLQNVFDFIEISSNQIKVFDKDRLDIIKNLPFTIIVDDIDSHEYFKMFKDSGFKLFKGDFFAKPENVEKNIENLSKLEILRLIRLVSDEDDLNTIAEYIKASPLVSVNLLKYINSSFFYLANPITSINRAVAYLGKRNIINWLILTSMISLTNSELKKEVIKRALFRAKFLELISKSINSDESVADMAFLIGTLSMSEAIFNISLEELLKKMNLNENLAVDIKEKRGYFGKLLTLVEFVEKNEIGKVKSLAQDLTLDSQEVAQISIDSLKWSQEMFVSLYK